jgi:hypothetical protein
MNIQQRIDQLQTELNEHSQNGLRILNALQHLQEQVKAEAAREETGPKLWVPKEGEEYSVPHLGYTDYRASDSNYGHDYDKRIVERGLAFRTAEDAVEVGEWLAVLGKIANLAKTANKGKAYEEDGRLWYIAANRIGVSALWSYNYDFGPRFHSREAADWALSQLSEREKEVLIRGIS